MSGKAAKVKCTEKQIEILEQIIKSPRSEQRLINRAQSIWHAFFGKRNDEISDLVGLDRGQVGLWRTRWKHSFDALVAIECRETRLVIVDRPVSLPGVDPVPFLARFDAQHFVSVGV